MFCRTVSVPVRRGALTDLNRTMNDSVYPLLQSQPGYLDMLVVANSEETELLAISMWTDQQSAEKYASSHFGRITEMMQPYINGSPMVRTWDVLSSSLGQKAKKAGP